MCSGTCGIRVLAPKVVKLQNGHFLLPGSRDLEVGASLFGCEPIGSFRSVASKGGGACYSGVTGTMLHTPCLGVFVPFRIVLVGFLCPSSLAKGKLSRLPGCVNHFVMIATPVGPFVRVTARRKRIYLCYLSSWHWSFDSNLQVCNWKTGKTENGWALLLGREGWTAGLPAFGLPFLNL